MSAVGLSLVWAEDGYSLASRLTTVGGTERLTEGGLMLAADLLAGETPSADQEPLVAAMFQQLGQDPSEEQLKSTQWPLWIATNAILGVARPEQMGVTDRRARAWLQRCACWGAEGQRTESLVAWALLELLYLGGVRSEAPVEALAARNGHDWIRTIDTFEQGLSLGESIDPEGLFDLPKHALVRLLAVRLLAEHDGFGTEAVPGWLRMHGFV